MHPTVLRPDEGLTFIGEPGERHQSVERAGPSGLRLPAGNRRRGSCIIRSLACRSARRQYAWRSGGAEPGAAHLIRKKKSRRWTPPSCCRREIVALLRGTVPARAMSSARRRPVHVKGVALSNFGIALGHVVLHEPRVIVTNYIADDIQVDLNGLRHQRNRDVAHLRSTPRTGRRHSQEATRRGAGSLSCSLRPRGTVRKLEEAVITGLTAEAAVSSASSDARRMLRPDGSVPARAAARPQRSRQSADAAARRARPRAVAGQPAGKCHRGGSLMGPAALLDYDRKRLRGLVLEEGGAQLPCRHRGACARHPGSRRGRQRHRHRRSGRWDRCA